MSRTKLASGRERCMGGWRTAARAGKASGAGKKTAPRGYARGPEIFHAASHWRQGAQGTGTSRVPVSTALCPLGPRECRYLVCCIVHPPPSTALFRRVWFDGLLISCPTFLRIPWPSWRVAIVAGKRLMSGALPWYHADSAWRYCGWSCFQVLLLYVR